MNDNTEARLVERLYQVTDAEPEEQWKHLKTILQETTALRWEGGGE